MPPVKGAHRHRADTEGAPGPDQAPAAAPVHQRQTCKGPPIRVSAGRGAFPCPVGDTGIETVPVPALTSDDVVSEPSVGPQRDQGLLRTVGCADGAGTGRGRPHGCDGVRKSSYGSGPERPIRTAAWPRHRIQGRTQRRPRADVNRGSISLAEPVAALTSAAAHPRKG